MALQTQFKHPTCAEYVSRGKEWYTAWTKVYGAGRMPPWEQVEKALRDEHAMVEKMDPTQRSVYWFEKAKKNTLVLGAEQQRLERTLTAAKARGLAGDALRDAKAQEQHARQRKG